MDAIEAMKTRRSIRSFTPEPISKDILTKIVDCGRMAATAINIQPWEFVVVTDSDMLRKIADTTDYGKFIAKAPACIVVLSKETQYYLEDGSAATQNILVAANALGLGSCWIAGDKKPYADTIRAIVGAPEGYKLISLVPLGEAAQDPHPSKRPINEVLHWEVF